MDQQINIQIHSAARSEAEANFRRSYLKMYASAIHCSKASIQELIARIFALPRELREMVYENLWDFPKYHWAFLDLILYNRKLLLVPPPACSQSQGTVPACSCLTKVPFFLNSGLMGKQMAMEMLDVFQREVKKRTGRTKHASYRIHWKDFLTFAKRDIFHLGLNLHAVLKGYNLEIEIDYLDGHNPDTGQENSGATGYLSDQLTQFLEAEFLEALALLESEDPRPITFSFVDRAKGIPRNMDDVFRVISVPFHKLKARGFDVRVTYTSYNTAHRYGGMTRWDLGSDGWKLDESNGWIFERSDVWSWSVYQWKVNFTRSNEWFQTSAWNNLGAQESITPCPNGPIDSYWCSKVPVWEAIRKHMYRTHLDMDKTVAFRRDTPQGEIFVECGCEPGKHTCSPYYLCKKHNGYQTEGLTKWCYKCAGMVAPA
ncbi:hypothetical protein EJ02DRAFT_434521 [Clathrospora elynae]|uniref:Uncharacterized protein n=1 Tax=Clathrospora elynae TaxID=706981 RepID=A0A6A5SQ15_9PLEO|nr:hypothetical protein EJ02DRAFT_434521 [Clathrospora elynae]